MGKGQRSYTGDFGGVRGRFDVNLSADNRAFVAMCERLRYEGLAKDGDIRRAFRAVMKPVRRTVTQAAKGAMRQDPRKAWKGVRVITLKKGQGVVIGLLNPRKAGKTVAPAPANGGKSGIRRKRKRSKRTNAVDSYMGADRSFILRMVNQGTTVRFAGTRSRGMKRAHRGKLTAKRFFDRAEPALRQAVPRLGEELMKIIEKKAKKK